METMIAQPWFIQLAVFGCFFCGVLMLSAMLMPSSARAQARIQHLMKDDKGRPGSVSVLRSVLTNYLSREANWQWMEKILPDNDRMRSQVTQRLIVGGFYREQAVPLFMFAKLVLMLAPLGIGLMVGGLTSLPLHWCLMVGALSGFLGLALPEVWLACVTRRRQRELRQGLPDFVDLVVTCVEGGMGFHQSLAQVNGELVQSHPRLCAELEYLMRDVHLGETLPGAFQRMWSRTQLEELRTIASFIDHAHRFGAAMGESLRELSDMLRFEREQRAEELAQKSAVKILLPTLLFIFPTIFVVLAGPAAIQISESFAQHEKAEQFEGRGK